MQIEMEMKILLMQKWNLLVLLEMRKVRDLK